MTPRLSNAIAAQDDTSKRNARYGWLALIAVFSIAGALLFYLLRMPLIDILLSDKYESVSDLLFGIAVAIALFNISNVFNWFSVTLGETRAVLINNIVGSSVATTLTVVLCLNMGISGAVWALIAGYALQLVTSVATFLFANGNLPRVRFAGRRPNAS